MFIYDMEVDDITERVIGVFYRVYNKLGSGFLEKAYENAMAIEFRRLGIVFEKQAPVSVFYDGEVVADYVADFIVDERIVEIKAKGELNSVDEAQLINYLRATGKKVGLLLNFGPKAEVKRRVLNY